METSEQHTPSGKPPTEPMTVEFLGSIIDNVAHPIFVKDRNFRFVLVNRALCEVVGVPREALLGKTDYDFFPKDEADAFRTVDAEIFASGQTRTLDAEPLTDTAGAHHVLATTKVALQTRTGEVTHLVGIIHDITRTKAIEEELRTTNDHLEERVRQRTNQLEAAQSDLLRGERLAVLGRLAGGLAHQIRNPLASIANAAFILRRQLRDLDSPDAERALSIILEETAHANKIITDLLDYARVRPPSRGAAAVDEMVRATLSVWPRLNDVEVCVELPALPAVAVDPDQLRSALTNLIDNAVEAMGHGGRLTIRGRAEDGHVVVTVTDTGPGIPDALRNRLFEPLVTTKPLGLGLGLTTARSLIENQAGTLRCVESSACGTTFEVRLPVAEAADASEAATRARRSSIAS